MRKLNLDLLTVESFATADMSQPVRGTVEARQGTGPFFTCWPTCEYTCKDTCAPSCRNTDCVTACQGGSQLTLENCPQIE
jgi:hypothetical protein